MAGTAQIGNLAVNLILETAAFTRGVAKAATESNVLKRSLGGVATSVKSFAGSFAGGLGIGIAATALGAAASSAFDMAAAMSESAQKMGVTVEAFQRLNLAAQQSGVSQDSLAGAMAKLNKALGGLEQGSKPVIDAFAKIGLSADDLKGKSPDQAFRIIADALNKLPDVQQRVAIGAQLMGRGFSELLPLINEGSKGLDRYAAMSQHNGEITTEEARQLDNLSDSWDRLKVRAGVATAKVIAGLVDYVTKADAWLANWERQRDGFIAAAEGMASGAISAINSMVSGIATAITGRLSAIWEGAKAKIESVKQKFFDMYDAVVGHSYVPDMVGGIAQSMAQLQRVMVDPSASAADKVGAIFQTLQGTIGRAFGSKSGGILSIIGQFAAVLAPLLLGGKGFDAASFSSTVASNNAALGVNLPGFASGGSGTFGGFGGIDRNVLSMNGSPIARVSRGEQFSVGQSGGKIIVELRDEMLDARIAGGANVQIVRAYPGIRAGALQAVGERGRRR